MAPMEEEQELTESSAEPAADAGSAPDYPDIVRRIHLGEREFVIVGTAHVSHQSVELVRQVIEQEQPDCVCVELDEQRYEALSKKQQWEELDIKQVIKKKQFATLMVNLMLASYQKRMGLKLGIQPGEELLEATKVAKANDIPIELCDRDVRVTLRRAIAATPIWRRLVLSAELLLSAFDNPELSEEQLEQLKQQDVLNELMAELGRALPALKRVLIDERDAYLTERMKGAPGRKIVAVVGAGHLRGICETLESEDTEIDLDALNEIPPVSPLWKWIGWGIPVVIIGSIIWIAYSQGLEAAEGNIVYWILVNGVASAAGGVLALAHPLTILTALVAAPITSLTPVIGAGYVCVFVQAVLVPPVVREFHSMGEDIVKPRRWWQSRLLRLFLTFMLTGWGSFIGSVLGVTEIVSTLVQ